MPKPECEPDPKKEKDARHVDNLQKFTGFWHGTYFIEGQSQFDNITVEITPVSMPQEPTEPIVKK